MAATTTKAQSGFSRRNTPLDGLLSELGRALQVLGGSVSASRPNPADQLDVREDLSRVAEAAPAVTPDVDSNGTEPGLTPAEQRHAAGLMRVNHVGEVCAQALYRGQALFCRDAAIQSVLLQAAAEEVDHLVWCNARLVELNSRPSVFNPLWYGGSFALGVLAGRGGVGRNLGFMAETESQVEQHLDRHLEDLPVADTRSRAIITQMRDDEIGHRNTAEEHGAVPLPFLVRGAMKAMSKVMTTTAYRI